ncbi:transmembrane protein 106A [Platysternon megacephalum]|uniref:Transmembrane protein 106A n=1 Tax=Platysternon megacephalum TaxID=55544 RepID=A0A4D9EIW5_9SAUR|nr:transmembrane protein 106A [Platysternon megacephalum]
MPRWWISPELNRRAGLLIYSSWLVKHKINYGLNYYVTLLILSDKCSGFFHHIWSQSHYFIALVQGLQCKKTFWNILQFPAVAPVLETVCKGRAPPSPRTVCRCWAQENIQMGITFIYMAASQPL